jgi:hypothetical protein
MSDMICEHSSSVGMGRPCAWTVAGSPIMKVIAEALTSHWVLGDFIARLLSSMDVRYPL